MLTLQKHPANVRLCTLVQGKKKTPVFWHPRIDKSLMNEVENVGSFNTEPLRDKYELSEEQANEIFTGLRDNVVCEHNSSKFFKCKRHVSDALIGEMDISDTDGEFVVDFDKDPTTYSGHALFCGGTNSGKTTAFAQQAQRCLDGPKAQRRRFLIFSAEWDSDSSLSVLKKDKYYHYVQGIDCSESSFKDSNWQTEQEFFQNEIKKRVEYARPGTIVFFDDIVDQVSSQYTRTLINRLFRTARHQGLTICIVLHNLRSGAFSTQAHSSIKFLHLFPKSQKGKLTNFLNRDLGLPMQRAREHIQAFGQTGRRMTVRLHAPECLIGEKLIRLL